MDLYGFIAGSIITIATLPQLFYCIKQRTARFMNLLYIILMIVGLFMWLIHGIVINDLALIVFNGIGLCQWIILFIIKIRWN